MKKSKSTVQVIVVEDEILLAKDIALRLKKLNYKVVGIAASAQEAIKILKENPTINIALLDIMIEGEQDGIELSKIIKRDFNIPFIFLTSHTDNQVVDRVKAVGAYAYILKPFNHRQVKVAIELALVNFSNNTIEKDLFEKREFENEENQLIPINDYLFLKKERHFERVAISEILFLEADGNYTTIHTINDRFLYSIVLKNIEPKFPIDIFLRVHRSYMVNIKAITGFKGNLLYIGNHKIPVSKAHKNDVFKLFPTL